jgi:Transcriptional regulator, AbiEi antitoxin, Type IV TA system
LAPSTRAAVVDGHQHTAAARRATEPVRRAWTGGCTNRVYGQRRVSGICPRLLHVHNWWNARQVPGRLLLDFRLRTDPKGEVEILRRFWPFETEPPRIDLTPPVLVYEDLLAAGNARCIETAGKVRERDLGRLKD